MSTGLPGTSLASLSDSASSGIGGGANAARVEVENNSLRAVVIAGKLAIQACAKTPACSTALEEEGLGALLGIGAAKTVMDNLSSSEQMYVFFVAMNGGRADLVENLTPEQRATYDYIVEQDKKGPFHLLPAQQSLYDGTHGPGHTELTIADQDPTGGKLVNPDRSGEQGATHTGADQPVEQGATNTGNLDGAPDTGGNTVTPVPDGPDKDDLAYLAKGDRPANLSPEGSARSGAFNEAKRQSGIPVSQSPSSVSPNVDKRGNAQLGYIYEFELPKPGGGTQKVYIRDDAGGHFYKDDPGQNRGPHFNDEQDNHYDY
ncbi:HNH/endonuclease VII fold putative polymorphic toxin [Kosakonia radicincitans]|uniref:HNH/endonuclease VII fold putative polymorphic toxin n=1 Tax=Kosakonia radicincitans TaxID=283686 RepID=UPI0008C4DC8D|nr:HNH/endonuclease VII fold putative polymorphic toxin [Kosakonia radicincitans]SET02117.1 HNH/Endo VII superfamily nuclease toxins [Kosakonia radicincitans]